MLDNRYADNNVVSHTGSQEEAVAVEDSGVLFAKVEPDTQVVAIDEAQFFDMGLVDVCRRLADQGKRVIVAGLDMDFRGLPFGPPPPRKATAEYVDKLQANCIKFGNPANRPQRLVNGKPARARSRPFCWGLTYKPGALRVPDEAGALSVGAFWSVMMRPGPAGPGAHRGTHAEWSN